MFLIVWVFLIFGLEIRFLKIMKNIFFEFMFKWWVEGEIIFLFCRGGEVYVVYYFFLGMREFFWYCFIKDIIYSK